MKYLSIVKKALIAVSLWGLAASVHAQWSLDTDNSSLDFISTKNSAVAESHSFDALSGSVSADGAVKVAVELDSVNTLIDIRNERIRSMLFETANFPLATVAAKVDAGILQKILESDSAITMDIPVSVSLHGRDKMITASVVLARTSGGGLLAVTSRPILISAADFGLASGIELLRNAAGLNSISSAVPVSFSLEFVPAR